MSEKEIKKVKQKKTVNKTVKRSNNKEKLSELIKDYKKKIVSKEICKGIVSIVEKNRELDADVLVIKLNGFKGIIKKEDVDMELNISSLVNFVGREVYFVIKSVNEKNKTIVCSRKEAQIITRDNIIGRLKDGEAFNSQIINILPHGAYVEIQGVTGLLKNTDYAEDYTTIAEKFSQGDKLNVKLKKTSTNGLLIFEATKKYCNPNTIKPEELEENQIVLGVIRSIKPFGIFVNVAPYLDILCSPEIEEYEEDKKVQVKIVKVEYMDFNGKKVKRFKGKILKTL